MSPTETWRPVVGFEGLYEVSDHGRLRSLDRMATHKNGRRRLYRGRVLAPKRHPGGYVSAMLSRGGERQYFLVHAIVLGAFVGPRPDGHEGCHWNGDKADNRLSNLRWATHLENEADKDRHGTRRRRACPRGHEKVERNRRSNGKCVACHRASSNMATSGSAPWSAAKFKEVADAHFANIMGEAA